MPDDRDKRGRDEGREVKKVEDMWMERVEPVIRVDVLFMLHDVRINSEVLSDDIKGLVDVSFSDWMSRIEFVRFITILVLLGSSEREMLYTRLRPLGLVRMGKSSLTRILACEQSFESHSVFIVILLSLISYWDILSAFACNSTVYPSLRMT